MNHEFDFGLRNLEQKFKPAARPPFPWVGGKSRMLRHIVPYAPEKIDTYWEPFLGGGSVFFALHDRMDKAFLRDINEILVTTYRVLKEGENMDSLIHILRQHKLNNDEFFGKPYRSCRSYFEWMKQENPKTAIDIAARFIYLINTSYRSRWVENREGRFVGDEDKYTRKPGDTILREERLREAGMALQKADIGCGDFESIDPGPGSFVFCDPPYETKKRHYLWDGFGERNQTRLAAAAKRWVANGAKVVLTQKDSPFIRDLYTGWHIKAVVTKYNLANVKNSVTPTVSNLIISSGEPGYEPRT